MVPKRRVGNGCGILFIELATVRLWMCFASAKGDCGEADGKQPESFCFGNGSEFYAIDGVEQNGSAFEAGIAINFKLLDRRAE